MRSPRVMICGLLVSALVGCASTEGISMFKNRDYADPTEGADDPWISNVGKENENRGIRKSQLSEEPRWFRELTMSDRAREIEANVGITD